MRNTARTALVAAMCLMASGCMVGPNYVRPTVDSPPAWRVSDPAAKALANTEWWQQFNDPVLDALVVEALRENKDLLIATARIEEYAGRYGITRSQLFPQVGLGADASRQRGSVTSVDATSQIYSTYDALLGVNWEIDLWGKIRRQSEAARAQIVASEEGRQGVILTLVAGVASGYINLRALDRQLEVARNTANTRGASYKIFQDRFAGGV
ncbi:MAG: TolC family protein [Burkholderiaceae bacterium]|nr:TolC family protein [Burkholderiaceae bacterium]